RRSTAAAPPSTTTTTWCAAAAVPPWSSRPPRSRSGPGAPPPPTASPRWTTRSRSPACAPPARRGGPMAEPGPSRGVFVLAVNPCAGRGRALEDAHRAAELLRTGGDEAVVLSAADLGTLVGLVRDRLRAHALTTRALVVVGGDGMVQAGLGV